MAYLRTVNLNMYLSVPDRSVCTWFSANYGLTQAFILVTLVAVLLDADDLLLIFGFNTMPQVITTPSPKVDRGVRSTLGKFGVK